MRKTRTFRLAALVFAALVCCTSCVAGDIETMSRAGETGPPTGLLTDTPSGMVPPIQNVAYTTIAPEPTPFETPAPTHAPGAIVGDNLAVSRAMAAKMLSLALTDRLSIEAMDREIAFADVSADAWYDKYVNAAFVLGFMSGTDKGFLPEAPLTLNHAQMLLDRLDAEKSIKIKMDDGNKDKPVSYALWVELYQKLLTALDNDAVELKNFVVLASPGSSPQLKAGRIISDIGPYTNAGLNMDAYTDRRVEVLARDAEVLAVVSVVNDAPTIYNAYITSFAADSVTIFSGGVERTYKYSGLPLNDGAAGAICDIQISAGKALAVNVITESVRGVVSRTNTAKLELRDIGQYPRDENFKVYSVADGAVKWKSDRNILVGTDMAVFYLSDGMAKAGVITNSVTPDQIRVAIGTTGFAGLIHKEVQVSCGSAFTVTAGGTVKNYSAGEVFDAAELRDKGRIYVRADKADGRILIKTVGRSWPDGEIPAYRGTIEIGVENGGYSVVNELPLEEYLYAVVPSEMPSSFGVEAAKVQAVTARSFAYNQIFENKYSAYGANVDDSVMCQVYNNIPENDTSRRAVDATRGLCLAYNGDVISANFFSTSAGVTANSGEVWASPTKEFPASTPPYLTGVKQYIGADYGDLAQEENAAAFFKAWDVGGYDAGFAWFRWKTVMSEAEIAAAIDASLSARYNAAPSMIKTLQNGNVFRSRPISTVGDVLDMEVTARGQGGNIMEMKITGAKATVLVRTEYNVRAILKPSRDIARADGSTVSNYSIMPSAFFVMDKTIEDGKLVSVTFHGGGNGHGVGMSQNGVKGMIDEGVDFAGILAHYYPGTELKQLQ